MRARLLPLLPALLVAGGLLVATVVAVSVGASGSGWAALVGPAVLAAAILAADALRRRVEPAGAPHRLAVWLLAVAVLAAAGLVALRDPARVALLLPVLGAAAGWLVTPARCLRRTG